MRPSKNLAENGCVLAKQSYCLFSMSHILDQALLLHCSYQDPSFPSNLTWHVEENHCLMTSEVLSSTWLVILMLKWSRIIQAVHEGPSSTFLQAIVVMAQSWGNRHSLTGADVRVHYAPFRRLWHVADQADLHSSLKVLVRYCSP